MSEIPEEIQDLAQKLWAVAHRTVSNWSDLYPILIACERAHASNTLLSFASELERERNQYIHENMVEDPETGVYEGGRNAEAWVADREELIERIQLKARELAPDPVAGHMACTVCRTDPVDDVEVETVWNDFWKEICEQNGVLNRDQIKRELFDFKRLQDSAGKVYDHVTGGQISKLNTDPDAVIAAADDFYNLSKTSGSAMAITMDATRTMVPCARCSSIVQTLLPSPIGDVCEACAALLKLYPDWTRTAHPRPPLLTTIQCCARCGKDHENIELGRFTRPPSGSTHFATCPKTREPILIAVVDSSKPSHMVCTICNQEKHVNDFATPDVCTSCARNRAL